jgi:hypothetical protein
MHDYGDPESNSQVNDVYLQLVNIITELNELGVSKYEIEILIRAAVAQSEAVNH